MAELSFTRIFLGFLFAVFVSLVSYRLNFLTLDGAIAATITGALIFGFGALPWALPLLTFFFSSSLLSKLKKSSSEEFTFEKTGTRNAWQVFANGGAGVVLTLFWFLTANERFYLAYLGSLAAVTADTWGTEFGTMMRRRTILLTTLRMVPSGVSGGVSLPGTVAGLIGACCIALSGWRWMESPGWPALSMIVVSGLVGSGIDSVFGSTLQAQYRCRQCGRLVEHRVHCNTTTALERGRQWMTNDWVNVACSAAGAAYAFVLNEL